MNYVSERPENKRSALEIENLKEKLLSTTKQTKERFSRPVASGEKESDPFEEEKLSPGKQGKHEASSRRSRGGKKLQESKEAKMLWISFDDNKPGKRKQPPARFRNAKPSKDSSATPSARPSGAAIDKDPVRFSRSSSQKDLVAAIGSAKTGNTDIRSGGNSDLVLFSPGESSAVSGSRREDTTFAGGPFGKTQRVGDAPSAGTSNSSLGFSAFAEKKGIIQVDLTTPRELDRELSHSVPPSDEESSC